MNLNIKHSYNDISWYLFNIILDIYHTSTVHCINTTIAQNYNTYEFYRGLYRNTRCACNYVSVLLKIISVSLGNNIFIWAKGTLRPFPYPYNVYAKFLDKYLKLETMTNKFTIVFIYLLTIYKQKITYIINWYIIIIIIKHRKQRT